MILRAVNYWSDEYRDDVQGPYHSLVELQPLRVGWNNPGYPYKANYCSRAHLVETLMWGALCLEPQNGVAMDGKGVDFMKTFINLIFIFVFDC